MLAAAAGRPGGRRRALRAQRRPVRHHGPGQGGSLDLAGGASRGSRVDARSHPDGRAGLRPDRRRRALVSPRRSATAWSSSRRHEHPAGDGRGWLDRIARAGGTVLTVARARRGAGLMVAPSLPPPISPACASRDRLRPSSRSQSDVYLVVNTGPTTRTFGRRAVDHTGYEQWDAMTGSRWSGAAGDSGIELTCAVRGHRGRAERRAGVAPSTLPGSAPLTAARPASAPGLAGGGMPGERPAGRPAARLGGGAGPTALLGSGDVHAPASIWTTVQDRDGSTSATARCATATRPSEG